MIIWLFFLGFFIILLFSYNFIVYSDTQRNKKLISFSCKSDSDCGSGKNCIFSKDYNQNICTSIGNKSCSIENGSLSKCDPNIKKSCSSCINSPPFECIEVSDEKPYTWFQNGKTTKIVNSNTGMGWCLPPINQHDKVSCNPYTSDTILINTQQKNGGPSSYNWGCFCNTNVFTQNNLLSDCNIQEACQYYTTDGTEIPNADIYVNTGDVCKNDGECTAHPNSVCWMPNPAGNGSAPIPVTDGKTGTCFTKWSNALSVNPLDGFCKCSNGYISSRTQASENKYLFSCKANNCLPGSGTQTNCKCPSGYLSCKNQLPSGNPLANQCETEDQCVPDPCAPGYYSYEDNTCICPAGLQPLADTDPTNLVKIKCGDVCSSNPCGNKGTCIAVPENTTTCYTSQPAIQSGIRYKPACIDCKNQWSNIGDSTCTCNTPLGAKGSSCNSNSQCASNNCTFPDCTFLDRLANPVYCSNYFCK